MLPYGLMRPGLFRLDPERAHELTLAILQRLSFTQSRTLFGQRIADLPCELMGIRFPNPVGLAAGFDKNGDCIEALAALGFGFIEVGTVTPRPQQGNPRPRMFRLQRHQAIINRLGFNNKGVDYLVGRVRASRYRGVLGINIGKNADTPLERALDDYRLCLERVYPYAGYVTVNISSPNTAGLRTLQQGNALAVLLEGLVGTRHALQARHGQYVPIAIKIAPDMAAAEIDAMADALVHFGMDAVIATNTTLSRETVAEDPRAGEPGGLSGAPLADLSTGVIACLARRLDGRLPIIGVGGILSGVDAVAKVAAGARLMQVYSGLIYRGPRLVADCVEALRERAAMQAS